MQKKNHHHHKVVKGTTLYDAFYPTGMPQTPVTITLPTRGTFAEAIPGGCNLCERIEEDQFGPKPNYAFLYTSVYNTASKYYGINITPPLAELTEPQKQQIFLTGTWKQITGILLHEFVTNTGLSVRSFYEASQYTQAIKNAICTTNVLNIFVKEYNKADSSEIKCTPDNEYFMWIKYEFSPNLNPYSLLPSAMLHLRALTVESDEIMLTRGGMKFKVTCSPNSPDLNFLMFDGYSLSSLGAHFLKSRTRNNSNTFGNTDIYVEFTVPKPPNFIDRP